MLPARADAMPAAMLDAAPRLDLGTLAPHTGNAQSAEPALVHEHMVSRRSRGFSTKVLATSNTMLWWAAPVLGLVLLIGAAAVLGAFLSHFVRDGADQRAASSDW